VASGNEIILSNAVSGGVWSSSNSAVAPISTDGIVSGLSAGTATISYKLTNGAGCASSATAAITVTQGKGGGININFGINPNPAHNEITISWQNQYDHYAKLKLMDVSGRTVFTHTVLMQSSAGSTSVPLNNVVPGVYMVSILSASDSYNAKLVVTK
jgi:hypothetical protein